MSELEEKLNALLSNPQLMQQIASMAQAMGAESSQNAPEPKETPAPPMPALDPKLIQTIAKVGSSCFKKLPTPATSFLQDSLGGMGRLGGALCTQ